MQDNYLELRRIFDDKKQIRGYLSVIDSNNKVLAEFVSLELPYKDNQNNISSIPSGTYQIKKRYSKKYGYHLHILNVPDRDYVLIHAGNYYNQTLGCVLVGTDFLDINNDGLKDVIDSVPALRNILTYLPEKSTITIT